MTFPSFASGEVLRAADMNAVGLWLIKSQAITGTPSTINVTNVFSADYDAYRVVVTGVKNTTSDIAFGLQLNGATTVGYYGSFLYVNYTNGSISQASNVNNNQFTWAGSSATGNNFGGAICEILNPFQTGFTRFISGPITYQNITGQMTGIQDTNASHTGFNLINGAGAFTGGVINVYGYKK
jgi:hypothetical protein